MYRKLELQYVQVRSQKFRWGGANNIQVSTLKYLMFIVFASIIHKTCIFLVLFSE